MPAKPKSGRPRPQAKATSWRKVDVASDALRFSSMGGFFSLEELDGDADGTIRWDTAKTPSVPDDVPGDAAGDAAEGQADDPAPENGPAPEPAAGLKPARKRKRKTKPSTEEPPPAEAARLPWAPPAKGQGKRPATERDDATTRGGPATVESAEADREAESEAVPEDVPVAVPEADMSAWSQLGLHPELLARLAARGFARPTPIQEACLPPALHGRRDIVGAAETGSGKTLAFGLPIMQRWLEARDSGEPRDGLFGLIITPTRELALQVADHLRALMPLPDASCARVVTLVGGMAVVKQKRQLQAKPEVVVATPGRLWELLSADPQPYLRTLNRLRFFVLDEVGLGLGLGVRAGLRAWGLGGGWRQP